MNTDDEIRLRLLAVERLEDRCVREQQERDTAAVIAKATEAHNSPAASDRDRDAAISPDGTRSLIARIRELEEQVAMDRAVCEAAEQLVEIQRRCAKAFRGGFEAMPGLVRTSGAHKILADQMSAAGGRLARAVDDRAKRTS